MESTLTAVIGRNVKRLRNDAERTQDWLAGAMRDLGPIWTQVTVATVEAGTRAVGVDELPVLALALGVPLAEMLRGVDASETVQVGDAIVDLAHLRSVFERSGRAVSKDGFVVFFQPSRADDGSQSKRPARLTPVMLAGDRAFTESEQQAIFVGARGAAERKAAAKLNHDDLSRGRDVDPLDVSAAAVGLWGRTLTEERDRRVAERSPEGTSARSMQAVRGRVTRELVKEIAANLETVATF